MINIFAYFFQTRDKKNVPLPLAELEMLNFVYVRLRPARRQLWLQLFALYLWLSLPFWCFLPRPPVQSKVGSLFMCKFAHRPYEGGACWISPFWALADYPAAPFGPCRPKPSCPDLLSLRLSLLALVSFFTSLPPPSPIHHHAVHFPPTLQGLNSPILL